MKVVVPVPVVELQPGMYLVQLTDTDVPAGKPIVANLSLTAASVNVPLCNTPEAKPVAV